MVFLRIPYHAPGYFLYVMADFCRMRSSAKTIGIAGGRLSFPAVSGARRKRGRGTALTEKHVQYFPAGYDGIPVLSSFFKKRVFETLLREFSLAFCPPEKVYL